MSVELGHEALAEPHDLAVAAVPRVEVGATLGAAEWHAGKCVLERLVKAEELDDPEVDGGMEPESPLVRPERGVELDAEAAVDVHLPTIVVPGDAEDDLALRFAQPLDDLVVVQLWVLREGGPDRPEHVTHGLVELMLAGIATQDLGVGALDLLV